MSNIETTQVIYEAFGRGDVDGILGQLADDVVWDEDAPSYGVPIYEPGAGKPHVQRFFERLQGLEIIKFQPTNFLEGGNQVAVTIDIELKVKETGNEVKMLEIHLWTFGEDGKVTRFFHSVDRHAVVLAHGL